MAEPTIICPKCKNEIKLNESLAAPLIEATRQEYEKRLSQKDLDIASREKTVRDGEAALSKAKEDLENQVEERLKGERGKISADEARKAKVALGADLTQKTTEIAELQEVLKQRDEKLAQAQKAQGDLIRKQRELDDAKREMELTIEKAEVSVLVSAVLPKGVDTFDQIDDVCVAHPRAVLPVALFLRQKLIEVNSARLASEGQQTKMELVYQYLTGPKFRLRVQAIVETFSSMRGDLDKERKAIMKQWAKREEQIERVMQSTVGMYGDLQGIAGKTIQEIEGLELRALEDVREVGGKQ